MGLISERRFSQDFKVVPEFDEVRGEYFAESKRSNVYLSKHECIEDIICTCTHETIHHVINQFDVDLDVDMNQEHKLIKKMAWANLSIDGGD